MQKYLSQNKFGINIEILKWAIAPAINEVRMKKFAVLSVLVLSISGSVFAGQVLRAEKKAIIPSGGYPTSIITCSEPTSCHVCEGTYNATSNSCSTMPVCHSCKTTKKGADNMTGI